MLLVYGGNGHNATDDNSGDVCFSSSFLAYDISCDTWRSLPLPSPSALGYSEDTVEEGGGGGGDHPSHPNHHHHHNHYQQLLGRYGHSSVVFEEALYIFGGFSGVMHASLLRYVPGNCSHHLTFEQCQSASFTSSAKCHWSKEKGGGGGGGVCQPLSQLMKASVSLSSSSSSSYSMAFNFCPENLATNFSELCGRQTLCANCLTNSFECVWCGSGGGDRCRHRNCAPPSHRNVPGEEEEEGGENPMLPKAEQHHHNHPHQQMFHHKSSNSRSSALSSLFGGGSSSEAEELKSSGGGGSFSFNSGIGGGIRDVNSCETRDAHLSNCERLHNCHACHTEHNCSWQRDRKCSLMSSSGTTTVTGNYDIGWQPATGSGSSKHIKNEKLTSTTSTSSLSSASTSSSSSSSSTDSDEPSRALCEPACHTRTTCENCTQGTCMWCSSLRQCIESNAYAALYPIGQCMEWTTHAYKCSALSCSDIQSCDRCLKSPQCGWCDNGSGTGVGVCLEGAARGPFALNSSAVSSIRGNVHHAHSHTHPQHQRQGSQQLDLKRCPAANWHFSACPACDCNGHAECHPLPPGAPAALAPACKKCHHRTEGERCERCVEGFYGNPVNGGSCAPCSCGGHSDLCHRETGKCSCSTKGITGHHCERCDEANNYVGSPSGDLHDGAGGGGASCFYNLSTSYSYTFNMSKPDDAYYTRINFMNAPLSTEIDIEFTVTCQESALVNISVGSAYNTSEC